MLHNLRSFLIPMFSSPNENLERDEEGESLKRALRHWHRLHREAVVPHPWRCSRLGWIGPWAAELVGGSPAHSRELGLGGL